VSLHVLFVDDERAVLDSLGRKLRQSRCTWEISYATDGRQALEMMDTVPVDAVIADSQMPGMDGATLLEQVQRAWPAVVRVMLSGAVNPGSSMRVASVAHQFFEKPCPADRLCDAIERIRSFRQLVDDPEALVAVTGITSLPSPPGVVLRLNQAIASERTTSSDIAAIVADDVAVAAKLLQLVNSAFFGLQRPTTSIDRAVGMLGTSTVRALASMTSIIRCTDLPADLTQHFDDHAQQVSARLAKLCPTELRDHAPSAGLLHDIGWLILADRARERFAEFCATADRLGTIDRLERMVFGASHCDVGAALLALWGLPMIIIESTAWHHVRLSASPLGNAIASAHRESMMASWLHLPVEVASA
jgi:HD-like signal output (HDOD) protein/ActR/RegA family two-component response regulator